MNTFERLMDDIADIAARTIRTEEGDYLDEEGFLVCGKCNTRKEVMIQFPRQRKVPCMCECKSAEYNAKEKAEADRQRDLKLKELREEAFPDRTFDDCTFDVDDSPECQISKTARKYVEHFEKMYEDGKGLVFFGDLGTGKTFYAGCIANALMEQGRPVLVTNFSRLSNTLFGMKEGRQEYLDRLNRYHLLIIDDYASERESEWMTEIIYSVIDNRYRAGLPVIVTTNLSRDQLKDKSDIRTARILSRLYEMCIFLHSDGKDRRTRANNEANREYKDLLGLPD